MPALLNGSAIGTVQGLQECFGFMLHNLQGKSCLKLELGGGVLLNAGSCARSLIRLAMWQALVRVPADAAGPTAALRSCAEPRCITPTAARRC